MSYTWNFDLFLMSQKQFYRTSEWRIFKYFVAHTCRQWHPLLSMAVLYGSTTERTPKENSDFIERRSDELSNGLWCQVADFFFILIFSGYTVYSLFSNNVVCRKYATARVTVIRQTAKMQFSNAVGVGGCYSRGADPDHPEWLKTPDMISSLRPVKIWWNFPTVYPAMRLPPGRVIVVVRTVTFPEIYAHSFFTV